MSVRTKRGDSGFVLVTVAIFLLALICLAGFAVDLGSWYLRANKLQRATDAAALAAVTFVSDPDKANEVAQQTLRNNGFNLDNADITTEGKVDGNDFSLSITDHKVPTYFIQMIKPSISISRSSVAQHGGRSPALGSPYNVLGTGDLSIPNIPKQKFWLAINGHCDAKEDGDYFNSWYDANKGPFTGAMNERHEKEQSADAYHHCPLKSDSDGKVNTAENNGSGYNYFVDVPPTQSGSVDISVYDPSFIPKNVYHPDAIDSFTQMSKDWVTADETQFLVYKDVNNTPTNFADDEGPIGGKLLITSGDDTLRAYKDWMTLYTASGSEIANGARYRINVSNEWENKDAWYVQGRLGINAFALGAFRNGQKTGCDTRTDIHCPRTYGSLAMSVYNSLSSTDAGKIDYYFADIDESYIGTTLNVFLWDPGEGVKKLEMVAPDGTKLPMQWTSIPDAPGLSGSGKSIDTDGYGPPAQGNLSNEYKYNDRLLSIKILVPQNYGDMIAAANGDTGIRLRYTVDDSPNDRMTFGMSVGDGVVSPNHLKK